ncbi:SNF2 family N-terminal domain-containing protein [Xylaria sp. FL0043]|nr:SNF2 family N-terminal domain-containing protein [Xylaria sp. FL0043]
MLDTGTASKLMTLKVIPTVRFEALINSNVFTKRQRRGDQQLKSFDVSINIFGPRSVSDDVGHRLSAVSAYLQHPKSLDSDIEYRNPQFLTFGDEDPGMRSLIGLGHDVGWQPKINSIEEIGRILDSLMHVAIDGDLRLPPGLISQLKGHQEDGLRFILQRENEMFSRQLSMRIRDVSGIRVEEPSSFRFGGLIADAMGLGKSLTLLTAILHSSQKAEDFSMFSPTDSYDLSNRLAMKGTLIVATSAQILENWESEIKTHFQQGTLKFIRFHGPGRPRSPEDLRPFDVILTTYSTLAADHSAQSVLFQVEWYRVALDEAHWIRNTSTKFFEAAANLRSKRRWCLTGTPIQNKLNDLTALAQFIQVPYLSTRAEFQKQILAPLSKGGLEPTGALRTYLECYCLRRNQECLLLPPSRQESVSLQFSSEEQHVYDQVLDETSRQSDSLVSEGNTTRFNLLFKAMLKMRVLCNLGTISRSKDGQYSNILTSQDLEIKCARCSTMGDDISMLLTSFEFCPDCGRQLRSPSPLPSFTRNRKRPADMSNAITLLGVKSETAKVRFPRHSPDLIMGYSTKLVAVVNNIVSNGLESKSIVFSSWTSTLDPLSELLRQENIPHCQIDGRVGLAQRSERLRAFKEDPDVTVLLMTIDTGAVGLTLTVANRVHIVEPQWNPSVEEQAIARALRMGQTREVTIIRYSIENTVEENITMLQRKKKALAKVTFDTGFEDSLTTRLEDLQAILK